MNLRPAHLLYKYLDLVQFSLHKAMMHYKLKRISPEIKGRWLDIGAGDQPYKKYFAGADEYLTTNTKRHYHPEEIDYLDKYTTYWIDDGKMLPLPDNSLEGVACFQVLSVIDKPEDFFIEINRVLKPGGKLVLTTDFLYPAWSKEDRYRHTEYSLKQLSELTGFNVESIESFGGFGSTVYKQHMRFIRTFPQIWKKKLTFTRFITAFPYILVLIFLPVISLAGMLIFYLDKDNISHNDLTFNMLLLARKITE
jgi:SAM-dependent methyltransferase